MTLPKPPEINNTDDVPDRMKNFYVIMSHNTPKKTWNPPPAQPSQPNTEMPQKLESFYGTMGYGREEYQPPPQLQPGGYWENPLTVARWNNFLETMPDDWVEPPWMDRRAIQAAYNYMSEYNQGEHWTNWQPLPESDLFAQQLRTLTPPPEEFLPDRDLQPPGRMSYSDSGVYQVPADVAQQVIPKDVLDTFEVSTDGSYIVPAQMVEAYIDQSKPEGNMGIDAAVWDKLPGWQRTMIRVMPYMNTGMGAGMGALAGLSLGGVQGAVVGSVAMGGLSYAAEKNPKLATVLNALDVFAETAERVVGVAGQIEASILDPKRYGPVMEVLKNLDAAYQAAHLTYEVSFSEIGKRDTYGEGVYNWEIGRPEPIVWQPPDEAIASSWALTEARRMIMSGAAPTDVWEEVGGKFGFAGQMRDMVGHMLIDPLNLTGDIGNYGVMKLGGKVGLPEPLIKAAGTEFYERGFMGSDLLGTAREYGRMIRAMPADEAARFGALSRWIARVDVEGKPTYMKPGAKMGFLDYAFGMTPQARTAEILNDSMNGIQLLAQHAGDDPHHQVAMLLGVAGVDPAEAVKVVDEAILEGQSVPTWFGSAEGQGVSLAMRDSIKPVRELLEHWDMTRPQREAIQRVAEYMGVDEYKLMADLHEMKLEQANGFYKAFLEKVNTAGSAKGADEAAKLRLEVFTKDEMLKSLDGTKLKGYADMFLRDNGAPYSGDQFKHRLLETVMKNTEEYYVKWFGVKPQRWYIRLSNVIKRAQGLALLGFNPSYFLNNVINNIVTMGWDGLLSFSSHKSNMQFLKRMGIVPARLRTGMNSAEIGDINLGMISPEVVKGGYQPGEILRNAVRGDDFIQKMDDMFRKGDKFAIFANLSSKMEAWSSEMAMVKAMRDFWGRHWKEGVGYDRLDNDLRLTLDAVQPGLANRVEKLVRRGMNKAEIEEAIFNNLGRKSLHDVLDVEEKSLIDAHFPELFDDLEAGIGKAGSDEEVRRAFTQARERIEREISDEIKRNAEEIIQNAKTRTQVGKTQDVLDAMDGLYSDLHVLWHEHFRFMDQVADEAARAADRFERRAIWEQGLKQSDRNWNNYQNLEGATWLGVFRGLEADGNTKMVVEALLWEMHDNRAWFYDGRRQRMNDYYAQVEMLDWDDPKRTELWHKVNEELNNDYRSFIESEDASQQALDQLFVEQYKGQFRDDPEAGNEAQQWRDAIRNARRRMAAAQYYYRGGEILDGWGLDAELIQAINQITKGKRPYEMDWKVREVVAKQFFQDVYSKFIDEILDSSNRNAPGSRRVEPIPPPEGPEPVPEAPGKPVAEIPEEGKPVAVEEPPAGAVVEAEPQADSPRRMSEELMDANTPEERKQEIKDYLSRQADVIERNARRMKEEAPKRYREQLFHRYAAEVYGDEDMAADITHIYNSIADYLSEYTDETGIRNREDFYSRFEFTKGGMDEQGRRGVTRYLEDGRALIHAYQNADISTLLHEVVEAIFPFLRKHDLDIIERFLKEEHGIEVPEGWHRGYEHAQAKDLVSQAFERTLAEGVAATPELMNVFQRIKKWMLEVYQGLANLKVKPNEELDDLFRLWLGMEPGSRRGEGIGGGPDRGWGRVWSEDERMLRTFAGMDEAPVDAAAGIEARPVVDPAAGIGLSKSAAVEFPEAVVKVQDGRITLEFPEGLEPAAVRLLQKQRFRWDNEAKVWTAPGDMFVQDWVERRFGMKLELPEVPYVKASVPGFSLGMMEDYVKMRLEGVTFAEGSKGAKQMEMYKTALKEFYIQKVVDDFIHERGDYGIRLTYDDVVKLVGEARARKAMIEKIDQNAGRMRAGEYAEQVKPYTDKDGARMHREKIVNMLKEERAVDREMLRQDYPELEDTYFGAKQGEAAMDNIFRDEKAQRVQEGLFQGSGEGEDAVPSPPAALPEGRGESEMQVAGEVDELLPLEAYAKVKGIEVEAARKLQGNYLQEYMKDRNNVVSPDVLVDYPELAKAHDLPVWVKSWEGLPDETINMHTDANGNWLPERIQEHEEKLSSFLDKATPVPEGEQPVCTILIGAPAVGKTTIRENRMRRNAVTIDSDELRKSREYIEATKRYVLGATEKTIKEARYLNSQLFERAIEQRKNIIYDFSGSDAEYVQQLIQDMKAKGYRVELNMAYKPIEQAWTGMIERANSNGRFVNREFFKMAHENSPRSFMKNYEDADTFVLYDTVDNNNPRIVWENDDILDIEFVEEFRRKYGDETTTQNDIEGNQRDVPPGAPGGWEGTRKDGSRATGKEGASDQGTGVGQDDLRRDPGEVRGEEGASGLGVEAPEAELFEALNGLLQEEGLQFKEAGEFEAYAEKFGIDLNDQTQLKLAYDVLEGAINKRANQAVSEAGDDLLTRFKRLAELEESLAGLQQPEYRETNTPLPVAYAAQVAADIRPGDVVGEPTGGNGNLFFSLLDRNDITLKANEIDAGRQRVLRLLGMEPTGIDVLSVDWLFADRKNLAPKEAYANVMLSRSPWGPYGKGKYGRMAVDGTTVIKDVSQLFAKKSLEKLPEGGRYVGIVPTNWLYAHVDEPIPSAFFKWLEDNFAVRAVIESPAGANAARGTNEGSVLIVVDKVGTPERGMKRIEAYGNEAPGSWKEYASTIKRLTDERRGILRDEAWVQGGQTAMEPAEVGHKKAVLKIPAEEQRYYYTNGDYGMTSSGSFTKDKTRWIEFSYDEAVSLGDKKPYGARRQGVFTDTSNGNSLKAKGKGDAPDAAEGLYQPALADADAANPRRTWAFGGEGEMYDFEYRIVDLDELIASHNDNFQANPDYPAELQPRFESRSAQSGKDQAHDIASKLNPKMLLTDSHYLDSGPPIMGADMVVENGNGRILGLRRARDFYPDKYQAYMDAIRGNLEAFGLDESDLEGIAYPTLMRERITDVDRVKFATEAQQGQSMKMTELEHAFIDTRYVDVNKLAHLAVGEDQSIEGALLSPSNQDIVDDFLRKMPQQERAELMAPEGGLNERGLERLKYAVLVYVYRKEAGRRLVQGFKNLSNDNSKNVEAAVFDSLGVLAKAEAMARNGDRDATLAIADDFAAAFDMYARLKAEGSDRVDDYLAMEDLFQDEISPFQKKLVEYINDNSRSRKAMREMIAGYAQNIIDEQQPPGQVLMFGAPPTKGEILDGVLRKFTDKVYRFADADTSAPMAKVWQSQPGSQDIAVGAPLGTVDSLSEPPIAQTNYMGMMQHIQPLLDKAERALTGEGAMTNQGTVFDLDRRLTPEAEKKLRRYLGKVYTQMADTKMGMMKYAEGRRDMALLNYSRRYGFDNMLGAVMPYQFWYGRSMKNWALRALTRPGMMANYARIRQMGHDIQREGYPNRLKGKMGIPMPFLPDWMGGTMFVDPLKQLYPFEQLARPFEKLADERNLIHRRAESVLYQMAEDEEITLEQAETAMETKEGYLWERAYGAAKNDVDAEIANPVDFMFAISSPSLPISIAMAYANGRKERIGQLPVTKLIQNLTASMKIGGPRGINIEKPIRKAAGLPEVDHYEDYRVDRMLSNMAAEGIISTDDALRAMIDRQGPVFAQAQQRVSTEQTWRYFGAPLGVDFFPEGEQEQRRLALEYDQAMDQWQAGDKGAIEQFWDEHPEYEARKASFREPEERLKRFMINAVWERYNKLETLEKRAAADQLGDVFEDAFLNKETRSYEAISLETLSQWARMLGDSYNLPEKLPETPQMGSLEMPGEYETAAFEAYNDVRDNQFPGIGKTLEEYYNLPEAQQKEFKRAHPEIDQYYRWRNKQLADNPMLIPHVQSESSELYGLPVEMQHEEYQKRAMKDMMYEERDSLFPGIGDALDEYYSLPEGAERDQYSQAHPEIDEYYRWRNRYLFENPNMIPLIQSESSELYGLPSEIQQQVYLYRTLRDDEFPGVYDTQDRYYDIENKRERKAFLQDHPELTAYWDFRKRFAAQYPQAAPYVLSSQSLVKYILGDDYEDYKDNLPQQEQQVAGFMGAYYNSPLDPLLAEELAQYYYSGEPLSGGALSEIEYLWRRSGRPGGDMQTFIEAYLVPQLEGML